MNGTFHFTPPSLLERKAKIAEKTLKYITHKYNYFSPKNKIKDFFIDSKNYFLISTTKDNSISILDLHNLSILAQIPNKNETVLFCGLNEKQNILYATFMSGIIKFWDFFNGELIFVMDRGEGYAVSCAAFSSSNEYFACAYENGDAFIFRTNDFLHPIRKYNFGVEINCFDFSFGSQLIAFGLSNGTIIIISIETDHMWKINGQKKGVASVLFGTNDPLILYHYSSVDGSLIATRYHPKNTKIFTVESRIKRRLISYDYSSDETIIFCATQNILFACNAFNGKLIQELNLSEIGIELIHTIRHPLVPHIVLVLSKTSVSLWNCKTSEYNDIWTVGIGNPLIHTAVWIDSSTIYVLMSDGSINIFSANSATYSRVETEIPDEWPQLMKKYFGQYKGNLYQRHAIEREKNILKSIKPCTVDLTPPSDTDTDDSDYHP